MTTSQAATAGISPRQLRTLVANGWTHPTRGVFVSPDPPDPFRASVSAALLVCPSGVVGGITAARLWELWGLPRWTPAERPQILLPVGDTYGTRAGVRFLSGLRPGERTMRSGFPVAKLSPTVDHLVPMLALDDLVCLLDSALRIGWVPDLGSPRSQRKLRAALALTDRRSESPFETRIRVRLVRAGLGPETLQFDLFAADGRVYARLDLAWPSVKLAVEADGRETHDAPPALYRDRVRANDVELEGWTILRFTWADLFKGPDWIEGQVRRALNRERVGFGAK